MHITFITPYPSSKNQHAKNTGAGSYSMYLVNELARQGHTIDIYAHQDAVLEDEKIENISVHRVWKKSFGGLFSLLGHIIRNKPKLVHIQHEVNIFGNELILPFTPFIAGLVRLFGGNVVTTFHGGIGVREIDREFVEEFGKVIPPWLVRFAFRYIFGLFSLFSHHIIVHEEFQKKQLIEEHGVSEKKITVVPHGVPSNPLVREGAREYFHLPEGKKVFLYMGFAARYKGLPELYAAYSEYIKNHKDVILLLGMSPSPLLANHEGYMEWYRELETKFTKLGESVQCAGFMGTEQIEYAYSIADRVLFPYSRRLAASGPMALAIGYGCDIVRSSILKDKTEYLFDLDDVEETTELKKYRTWEKIALKTISIYKNK